MKRILGSLLVLAFVSTSAWAVTSKKVKGKTGQEDGTMYYTIEKRDTLWDISGTFLADPFKWPNVWKINPYIKNPHLIYPGDKVRITPDGLEVIERKVAPQEPGELPVLVLEPEDMRVVVLEPEPEAMEAAPEPPPTASYTMMTRKGFIADKVYEKSGAIIKPMEEKTLLNEGDGVYISLKEKEGVRSGDRYTIYMKGPRIVHPVTGENMGYVVDVLGSLVVTEVVGVTEGRIDNSFKEIEKGAKLMPYSEPVSVVEIKKAEQDVTGHIVAALDGTRNISEGDLVYIDRGADDGLAQGNIMHILRLGGTARDPVSEKKIDLPPETVGSLLVIQADARTSACIVVKGLDAISTGDLVSTLEVK